MANQKNLPPLGDDEEDVNHRRRADFEDESGEDGLQDRKALEGAGFEDDFDDDFDDGDLDDDLDDDDLDDDDLDDDDLDDDELDDADESIEDEVLAQLAERFQGDDFRIVSLNDLASFDDIDEEGFSFVAPTLSLAEVLYNLVREPQELPANELTVFSDLSRADAEETRRVWPQIPLLRRRSVVSSVTELFAENLDLDFGAFLRIAIDDSDSVVQRFAVLGLSEEGASVDLLGRYVQFLQNAQDAELRAAAAAALGPFILDGELEEVDSALAMRAEQALMGVLTDAGAPIPVKARALESIAYSGELGVRQLIEEAYYSPDEMQRLSALVAMGRSADVRWRRLARAELTNPDPAMRAQAAFACGELEARAALPDLLRLLLDQEQTVRLAAMFALSHIGGKEARAALQAVVEGDDEVEAYAAEQALEEMDFYASSAAAAMPLFDESEAPGEWDGELDQDDDDLGQYE